MTNMAFGEVRISNKISKPVLQELFVGASPKVVCRPLKVNLWVCQC